jgi:hypothetical protein
MAEGQVSWVLTLVRPHSHVEEDQLGTRYVYVPSADGRWRSGWAGPGSSREEASIDPAVCVRSANLVERSGFPTSSGTTPTFPARRPPVDRRQRTASDG